MCLVLIRYHDKYKNYVMKRILVILAWIALFLPANAMDPVKKWGQLQVIGNQLCSENGSPVVLRGVSLGWHNL